MHTIPDVCALSSIEKDLLQTAAGHGGKLLAVTRSDTRGRAVRAGTRRCFSPIDRALADRYLAAIPHLVQCQLNRQGDAKDSFELTNFGWQLTRKLERQPAN